MTRYNYDKYFAIRFNAAAKSSSLLKYIVFLTFRALRGSENSTLRGSVGAGGSICSFLVSVLGSRVRCTQHLPSVIAERVQRVPFFVIVSQVVFSIIYIYINEKIIFKIILISVQ